MPISNSPGGFQRGVMTLVILGLLAKEDMYGYQLVQETERESSGAIVTQEGSLYPVLYKMVDQGFISDKKVQVGKRMTRVYYHLEPSGKQRLEELTQEYEAVTHGVLQIIRGAKNSVDESQYHAVSDSDWQGASGQLEAEEATSGKDKKLCPGLCF